MLKKLVLLVTIVQFSFGAQAANNLSSFSTMLKDAKFAASAGSEYISGAQPGAVLMKVNLWGAVRKPGIHHVPSNTDLIELISFAGGPTPVALLDDVIIKRDTGKSRKRISVDVEQIIKGSSNHNILLEPNDIIVIEEDEPLFSQDTVQLVTLSALLASIVLTVITISDR